MTTIYKKEQKTVEINAFVSCACDWCAKPMPDHYGCGEHKTREFEFTTGYSYPDDWGGTGWCIEDLCDECVQRLKDVLIKSGINIREIDF